MPAIGGKAVTPGQPPIFPTEDFADGRDSALDEALEILAHKAN
jgi:hypothetical protein